MIWAFVLIVVRPLRASKSTVRILLVDDDPSIERMVAELLSPPEFEIHPVFGGAEALKMLRESEFDIILLDLMLPGVNGFEILRDLKSRNEALLARTILVTGASDLTLGAFDKSQVFRLLRKPLAWSGLMRAIRECIEAQQKNRQWQATTSGPSAPM